MKLSRAWIHRMSFLQDLWQSHESVHEAFKESNKRLYKVPTEHKDLLLGLSGAQLNRATAVQSLWPTVS
eukprot:3352213-Amphidinium_carterae.1